MNVFNKVTLQLLKKNKTRTRVTIIGIMLSAAMICAVTTFVSSMQNYAMKYAVYTDGDWHGAVYSTDYGDYEVISTDEAIDTAAYGQLLGYAEINSMNEYKPYIYVIGGDKENFFTTMPVHMVSGRLPENSSEIILPRHLADIGEVDYKVGDKLTLKLGDRTLDGFSLGQNTPCYTYDSEIGEVLNDEIIQVRETRSYTVVGIYERPSFEDYTAPGFTALTVADADINETAHIDIYYKMKDVKSVYEYTAKNDLAQNYNTDVLLYSGISRYSSFSVVLIKLAIIVICLIMFGSVSLIYNAFSISVSERTKQFGLLSSVGATKKQLKRMVVFEALAVSAIGIPLGIAVGIGGIGVTLLIIGSKFTSMIGGSFDMPIRICVSWQAIVIAVAVALITVLISVWIPSKRVTRVSAVEAIRQNMDIKTKNKPVKTAKLTYKLFGLPGMLASKHYKRNRKRYRSTVISLFMSIVLFVSASAFTDYLMESVKGGVLGESYDLSFSIDDSQIKNTTPEKIMQLIGSEKYINDYAYIRVSYFNGLIDSNYLNEKFIKENFSASASSEDKKYIFGNLYFVNDEKFKELLGEYKLDESDYFNSEHPLGIALDGNIVIDTENGKYIRIDALKGDESEIECSIVKEFEGYYYKELRTDENGNDIYIFQNVYEEDDVMELTREEACADFTLRSKKTVTELPFWVTKGIQGNLKMIYPMSMLDYILPDLIKVDYSYNRFYMTSSNHAESYKNISEAFRNNGIFYGTFFDYAEQIETRKNVVNIIQVFAYGFIVLISMIAAANVFNTISTNIGLRRREFAMLKSVGMTQKGFNRMMNYECILYGLKALLYGLPVSAVITYLIYLAISDGYETTYHLPWVAIGIAVFSVFAVVFVTMLYSMSKIRRENPIDAFKNENL